jgi:hypothetical protein
VAPGVGRRYIQGVPRRRPVPTVALENFLYLLAEIEASLARGMIRWTPAAAREVQRRITNVLADVDAIAVRLREDC